MTNKTINYHGEIYTKGKMIQGKQITYIEYRNEELKKIKFFELYGEILRDVSDKEDLKLAIEENYIIENKDEII